jgi:hypothetical protein
MIEGATVSIVLDGVIVVLLAATIGYAFVLNRKLANLRATKGEMDALVARLVDATERAQAGLSGLREHAQESGAQIQRGIDAARGQADELRFLIERGEALAAKLEGSTVAARSRPAAGDARASDTQATRPVARGRAAPAAAAPAAAEDELLKTLQGLR